jgi:hypothetical protein
VLERADIEYQLRRALAVRMENRPGAGAATFRQLAVVGVNVELLLLVRISDELFYAVIWADDPSAPASVLQAA